MDERYRAIYGAIYVSRTADGAISPSGRLFGRSVDPRVRSGLRQAIEDAERSARARLREDAKALLAVNFEDLVIYPLVAGGRWRSEALEIVARDIEMLAADAAERSTPPDEAGISGHAIIDSLSARWSDLRTSEFRLWERTYE